jgi:hypothetical protein
MDDRTVPGSTTDHILATMPVRSARRLFELSAQEQHRRLVKSIRDRFVPYDGLIPYPADAVEEWLAQPIERCMDLDSLADDCNQGDVSLTDPIASLAAKLFRRKRNAASARVWAPASSPATPAAHSQVVFAAFFAGAGHPN